MSMPIPQLYRKILKLAKVFPSKNRESIFREIQLQFHRDKTLTDEKAIAERLSVALKGVEQLSMYTNLRHTRGDWSVQLEQNPFPKPCDKAGK